MVRCAIALKSDNIWKFHWLRPLLSLFLVSSPAYSSWPSFNQSEHRIWVKRMRPRMKRGSGWVEAKMRLKIKNKAKKRLIWGQWRGWDHVTPLSQSNYVLISTSFVRDRDKAKMRLKGTDKKATWTPSRPLFGLILSLILASPLLFFS